MTMTATLAGGGVGTRDVPAADVTLEAMTAASSLYRSLGEPSRLSLLAHLTVVSAWRAAVTTLAPLDAAGRSVTAHQRGGNA